MTIARYSLKWRIAQQKTKRTRGVNASIINSRVEVIDYKDVKFLSRFLNKQGQISPSIFNGLANKYQRKVAKAIKRAREMAFLPYNIAEQRLFENSNNSNYQQRNNKSRIVERKEEREIK